jgi:hypothetical protein
LIRQHDHNLFRIDNMNRRAGGILNLHAVKNQSDNFLGFGIYNNLPSISFPLML